MSKFKDMGLIEFVEDIVEIKLTHTQMVALELYEDLNLKISYPFPQMPTCEPGKPYVRTITTTKGECLDGRD